MNPELEPSDLEVWLTELFRCRIVSSTSAILPFCFDSKFRLLNVLRGASMLPKYRRPNHPGEILREEFLKPQEMTPRNLAQKMGIALEDVNLIIKEKRGITPEIACRLKDVFGASAQFWLNLQHNVDLWDAKHGKAKG